MIDNLWLAENDCSSFSNKCLEASIMCYGDKLVSHISYNCLTRCKKKKNEGINEKVINQENEQYHKPQKNRHFYTKCSFKFRKREENILPSLKPVQQAFCHFGLAKISHSQQSAMFLQFVHLCPLLLHLSVVTKQTNHHHPKKYYMVKQILNHVTNLENIFNITIREMYMR